MVLLARFHDAQESKSFRSLGQDSERLLNSFGGLVTNKAQQAELTLGNCSVNASIYILSQDIADHIVPLISRDPEAVKFLRHRQAVDEHRLCFVS